MIISVINPKGGTGKTTTSVHLSVALAQSGFRVLLVDLDPQAGASLCMGAQWQDLSPNMAQVLLQDMAIQSAIHPSEVTGLDIVYGEMELGGTDMVLADHPEKLYRLSQCLAPVAHDYDLIFCDCPPSLSLLTVNAIVAADAYLVVMTPEYLALEGMISLFQLMDRLVPVTTIDCRMLGILFTQVPASVKRSRQIMDLVTQEYGDQVFQSRIGQDIRLPEASGFGKTVFEMYPKSRGATAYAALAKEVAIRCGIQPGCVVPSETINIKSGPRDHLEDL